MLFVTPRQADRFMKGDAIEYFNQFDFLFGRLIKGIWLVVIGSSCTFASAVMVPVVIKQFRSFQTPKAWWAHHEVWRWVPIIHCHMGTRSRSATDVFIAEQDLNHKNRKQTDGEKSFRGRFRTNHNLQHRNTMENCVTGARRAQTGYHYKIQDNQMGTGTPCNQTYLYSPKGCPITPCI